MAGAPIDLPEREPLRSRSRRVKRDRTRDKGQLQITLPVGAGSRHSVPPTQNSRCRRGFKGLKQLGFHLFGVLWGRGPRHRVRAPLNPPKPPPPADRSRPANKITEISQEATSCRQLRELFQN